jgi:hypothetical protein
MTGSLNFGTRYGIAHVVCEANPTASSEDFGNHALSTKLAD